jgi:hypothetical protein
LRIALLALQQAARKAWYLPLSVAYGKLRMRLSRAAAPPLTWSSCKRSIIACAIARPLPGSAKTAGPLTSAALGAAGAPGFAARVQARVQLQGLLQGQYGIRDTAQTNKASAGRNSGARKCTKTPQLLSR